MASITYYDLATEARARWPQIDANRIDKAIRLARDGHVSVGHGKPGTAEVQSEHGSNWYHVDGTEHTCNCPDAVHRPQVICAHRLAVWLYLEQKKRTLAQAHQPFNPSETTKRYMKEIGF